MVTSDQPLQAIPFIDDVVSGVDDVPGPLKGKRVEAFIDRHVAVEFDRAGMNVD